MKWITYERPKIDRIACAWLVTRFIDERPEFLYVPVDQVLRIAEERGAVPYHVPGAELSNVGGLSSFDAFLGKYKLKEPALQHLAAIVRGADASRQQPAPESAGLYAVSLGLSHNFPNDQAMLRRGLVLYDALYSWCQSCETETHPSPPQPMA